jgi:aminopeptidase N
MKNPQETPRTIYLRDYQPPGFLVNEVSLRFELEPEATLVTNEMRLSRNPDAEQAEELFLDGEDLELLEVVLDDRSLAESEYTCTDKGLSLVAPEDAFTLVIRTRINPAGNTALEGLYQSSGNFCSQCEAQGFRKITYYPDRPDVLSRFTTTIVADRKKYPVLLSNGNPVDQGEYEDGRHFVIWEDPFRKPAYLFALVAGDLAVQEDAFITLSGREVVLRIYTEPHNIDKCDHAMRSLKRAMRWDEEVFGLEYDLDIYMIVAVDDFNMGAMENKGLNVFNSKLVFALPETATDDDFVNIEAVIGHEYFHNWTGNRVTCRDWFQLSLKEGLTVFRDQQFTGDMTSRAVKRIQDVRMLRTHQFAEDASPTAHPVRPDSYIEINNFYTVTVYEKGAEVVRMYHTLLGAEGFRRGMDLYFGRHDGQAVTTDDFCAAMADANGIDLSQFKRWYAQAGTPLLHASDEWDAANGVYRLTLSQECPATPGQEQKTPFMMPVRMALLDADGQGMPLQLAGEEMSAGEERVLTLTEQEQVFEFHGLTSRPLPSLLRGFSAPVRLKYDYSREQLAFLMAHDSDAFNRWEAGQDLALDILLDLVDKQQHGEALKMDQALVEAYGRVLEDADKDPAFVAEMLTLPGEAYIAEQMAVVDVDVIHEVRSFVRREISVALERRLFEIWRSLSQEQSEFALEARDMGQRRLKSLCLSYLVDLDREDVYACAGQQFDEATTMTDSMGALAALNHGTHPLREQCLQAFHDRWQKNTLVMDKWFSLQAMAQREDTLEDVRRLMQHPLFSIRNPNKVRALIGAFAQGNPTAFHKKDGSGYAFLADQIIVLDDLNPQVAARMVRPLSRWRRFDPTRQELMQKALRRILDHKDLSQDVYELVSKSLD